MRALLAIAFAAAAWAHAPISPPVRGPLRVEGVRLLDAAGQTVLLRGVTLPSVEAATPAALGVIRVRWNANAVRIPLAPAAQLTPVLRRAESLGLAVVLAAESAPADLWPQLLPFPNLLLSAAPAAVPAIRAAGLRQVVIAAAEGEDILPAARYRAEWTLPADPGQAFQELYDADDRGTHWTAATFSPGSLLLDTVDYLPTRQGETILTWITGDPTGFGVLRRQAIASTAGGPATPIAPGQLIAIYIEQMGPGAEVTIDGAPATVVYSDPYQINVHVPSSLQPGREATLQVTFQGIPSNRLSVPVVAAAPELFASPDTRNVIALNQNGTVNTAANPARPGEIVVFFGTGFGAVNPPAAPGLHATLQLPVELTVSGERTEILFAGEVPGFLGLVQINARLPQTARPGPVAAQAGPHRTQAATVLSLR